MASSGAWAARLRSITFTIQNSSALPEQMSREFVEAKPRDPLRVASAAMLRRTPVDTAWWACACLSLDWVSAWWRSSVRLLSICACAWWCESPVKAWSSPMEACFPTCEDDDNDDACGRRSLWRCCFATPTPFSMVSRCSLRLWQRSPCSESFAPRARGVSPSRGPVRSSIARCLLPSASLHYRYTSWTC